MRLKHFLSVFLTLLTLSVGQMWGADTQVYQLTITQNSTNTAYATYYDISVTDGTLTIGWKVPGNQNLGSYVKLGGGGKSGTLTNENRYVYSKTAISDNISKIVVSHGALDANVTVNSMTLTVYSSADNAASGTSPISTVTGTYSANNNVTFNRPDGANWAGRYYRLNYNISTSTKGNKGLILNSITFYKPAAAPSYTITTQSSNNTYGTVSLDGSVITATPAANCRIASTAYTVTSGTATVARGTGENINKFTVTPSSDCTVRINFEQIPTHTVTWSANGNTSNTSTVAEGAAITFPNTATGCEGGTFMGWASATIDGTLDEAPTYVTSANMGNTDITYYAVFADITTGTGDWEKCISATIGEGDYLIVSSNSYMMTNTLNSTRFNRTYITVSDGVISYEAKDDWAPYIWHITETSTSGIFTIKNGTKYVIGTGVASKADLVSLPEDDNELFAITYQSTPKTYKIENKYNEAASVNRFLRDGGSYFACYADGGYPMLFKRGNGYSNFRTSCCTSLGSINGSVNLDQLSPNAVEGKLQAGWQLEKTTGIGSLKLQLFKKGSPDAQVGNDIDVSSQISTNAETYTFEGLDHCAAYYVNLVATKDEGTYCSNGWEEQSNDATTLGYAVTISDTDGEVYDGSDLMGVYGADKANACAGETVTLTALNETGYHFASWSVTKTNGGAAVAMTGDNTFTMPAESVTVAATFASDATPIGITLTPNANATLSATVGGNAATEAYAGETVTLVCTDITSGYQFVGWTVTAGGEPVDVTNNTFIMPSSAVTVVADVRQTVTVTFKRDGSDFDTKSTYSGGTVTFPENDPEKFDNDYPNFIGWADAISGITNSAPTLKSASDIITEDVEYHAVFGTTPVATGNYAKITTLGELTDGKYVIVGEDNSTQGLAILKSEVYNQYYVVGTALTLTNDKVASPAAESVLDFEYSTEQTGWTIKYDDEEGGYLALKESNNHTNLKPNQSDAHYFTAAVNNGAWTLTSKTTDSPILYCLYTKNQTSTPEFLGEGDYTSNNIYLYKQEFAQDFVTRAVVKHTISYSSNGLSESEYEGDLPESEKVVDGDGYTISTATLSRDGYNFKGWNSSNTATTAETTLTNVTADVTLYAVWEEIPTYDIEFSVNGEKVDDLKIEDILQGDAISFPDAAAITAASAFPTTDKKFVGWIEASSYASDEAPTFVTSATVGNADKTYYAVFADEVSSNYTKVTSEPEDWSGEYILAYDNTSTEAYVFDGTDKASDYVTAEVSEVNSKSVIASLPTGGATITIAKIPETTNYSIMVNGGTNNGKYLQGSASNGLSFQENAVANKISKGSYGILFENSSSYMRFNTTSGQTRFRYYKSGTYTNSGYEAISLYKHAATYTAYVTTIAPLDHIAITTAPKAAYKKGEALDLSGMVVTAYYGSTPKVITNYTASPANGTALTTENTKVTISFSTAEPVEQAIHVYELSGIVAINPTKMTYNAGDAFDPEGMEVTATWGGEASDAIHETVTPTSITPATLTNDTEADKEVTVTITYSHESVEKSTTVNVTVHPLPSVLMTWSVAGATDVIPQNNAYSNGAGKYILKLPTTSPDPVAAGFTSDYEFKGWTKATSVNKDGTNIVYAAANDEQTQAETFYAVFAQKNGEDIPAGYKLKDEVPAADETILITRLVSGTYYAMTTDQTPSSSALTITNGVVSSSTSSLAWTVADATDGVSLRASSNYLHMNSSALKVASGTDNSDIVFTSNSDGSYKATRADGTRWIVTSGTNGFGCSATEENAAALYIFKYSAVSYATYSNYRLMPSSVKAPTGLAAGTYYCESKTITLAQEDSKAIYYTTNGDVPTNASTLYEGQFSVNASCTIKAVAYDVNEQDYSAVVEAEYVIVSSIDAPTMPASKTFYGTSESVEIEHALTTEGAVIRYSFDDVDYNDYSAALNITATTTVYAYATIGSLISDKVSATYTKGESVTYKKVTSAAELVPGMKFIIVSQNSDTYYAAKAGTLGSSSNAKWMDDVTITAPVAGEVTIGGADIAVFELGGKSGEYTMTSQDGVLGSTAAKKLSYEGGTTTWDITFSELGAATISNTAEGIGTLLFNYNNGDPRFTTYASGTAVEIYMQKPGYERTVREGYYGTICLPNGGKMIGTTLYEIAYYDAGEEKIFFDEVLDGNMVAGMPYIFQPVEGAQKLYQYSNASHVDSPVPAADANGLVGNLGSTITLSAGNYFLYNNQYYVVSASETRTISVPQYYAYINMSDVPDYPTAPAPGRRRVSMNVNGEQVATGVESIQPSEVSIQKVLINGELFILRGEKMYDATGRLVK